MIGRQPTLLYVKGCGLIGWREDSLSNQSWPFLVPTAIRSPCVKVYSFSKLGQKTRLMNFGTVCICQLQR